MEQERWSSPLPQHLWHSSSWEFSFAVLAAIALGAFLVFTGGSMAARRTGGQARGLVLIVLGLAMLGGVVWFHAGSP